jgi:ATP-dependent helicase/DNAse subunit B
LKDVQILTAMDRERSGKYIPVTFEDATTVKENKSLASAEEFKRLETLLEQQLLEMAEKIFEGEMDVRPLRLNRYNDACRYCKFSSVCRNVQEGGALCDTE